MPQTPLEILDLTTVCGLSMPEAMLMVSSTQLSLVDQEYATSTLHSTLGNYSAQGIVNALNDHTYSY